MDISLVDIPDKITSVVFLAGCNFDCGYCINSSLKPLNSGKEMKPDVIAEQVTNLFADACCVTGGEPTMQRELPVLLMELRKRFKYINLNTNGANPEVLKQCLPLVDSVYLDLKAAPHRYDEVCNVAGMWDNVEKSLDLMISAKTQLWPRTTYAYPMIVADDIVSLANVLHMYGYRGDYIIQDCFPIYLNGDTLYKKVNEDSLMYLKDEMPEGIAIKFNFRHPSYPLIQR